MKKLIGLLAVFFIVSSSHVFAQEYKVGNTGPSGGFIFFDKGNFSNGWQYLEATPSNQSSYQKWSNVTNVLIGTTGTAIGTGQANTKTIIAQAGHKDSAANLCDGLEVVYNGKTFNDYFLPSRGELNLMYENLHKNGVGGFVYGGFYWSSSEAYGHRAWFQDFNSGGQSYGDKNTYPGNHVRCARAF